ncbi:MAG TPA: hypothetical protein VMH39_16640, partial [Gemmatimonadaceae bacterium]|nr:hypothetical protein [Gemmatimonadaceae bacterium]
DLAQRPRTASEIVGVAFRLYRRAPVQCMFATAVLSLPLLVPRLLAPPAPPDSQSLTSMLTQIQSGAFDQTQLLAPLRAQLPMQIVSACIGLLVASLVDAAMARMGSELILGRECWASDGLRAVGRRFASVMGITILKSLALGLGLLCFLFPVLYVEARFFAPIQVAMIEGAGVGGAFRRSGVLSTGVKNHVLGTLTLVLIISYVLDLAGDLIGAVAGTGVVNNALPGVTFIVVYPFVALCQVVLYYDARARHGPTLASGSGGAHVVPGVGIGV